MKSLLLSFVVPCVKPSQFLKRLFDSLNRISFLEQETVELVLINQSGTSVFKKDYSLSFSFKEKVLSHTVPAYQARNLGAQISSGKYIFFLDDDAFIYSGYGGLKKLLDTISSIKQPTLILAQRGEIIQNRYITHWPKGNKITRTNFSRFAIEWNMIINKELFFELQGFDSIGPGSSHLAQCGEAFILMAKVFSRQIHIVLIPEIQVAHPSLFKTQKTIDKILGYAYGSGFAIGKSLSYFSIWYKSYWTLRLLLSLVYELARKKTDLIDLSGSKPGYFRYRLLLIGMKLTGFLDGFRQDEPRKS
jgi:glycosyltransferase involved in cell wall biosynthesis